MAYGGKMTLRFRSGGEGDSRSVGGSVELVNEGPDRSDKGLVQWGESRTFVVNPELTVCEGVVPGA